MTIIVGMSGSLRQGSYNAALLRAAAQFAPSGVTIDIGSIKGIPLYDADLERSAGSPVVAALKDRIAAADGLLLATPEYINSIPGVFKNAIDWLSSPPADGTRVFRNKPVGLIGASLTATGTLSAQAAWLPILRSLGTRPWYGKVLYVPEANKAFDASGGLIDESIRARLRDYVEGFAQFVAESRLASGTRHAGG